MGLLSLLYPYLSEDCWIWIGSSSEPWGRCSSWLWTAASVSLPW